MLERDVTEPEAGFQVLGRAWDPSRPDIIQLLEEAEHAAIQPIYYGSNHTFLVTLDADKAGESFAVYKPARGEYPLYDFPQGTLYQREVATWIVDSLLGWGLVPPTVVSTGRYGIGSVQLFIEAKAQGEIEISDLMRVALLDLITNNADRKAEHCLVGADDQLWAIDHGLTFNVEPKLRTVLWHFAGQQIPKAELRALRRLQGVLTGGTEPHVRKLLELLSRPEFQALRQRVRRLAGAGIFPDPRYKSVPYWR